ncbi:MAG: hypothetical protein JW920_11905 [Deltaproteobacteria bacterium]|nr:hypothetical protein [Deltaproteobacteria bacterium]
MAKAILTVLLFSILLLAATLAHGSVVRVGWIENSESDLAGYKVYYGTTARSYVQPYGQGLDVGLANSVEISLDNGTTYYFAITAYDLSNNESSYSNEISIYIPEQDQPVQDSDNDGIPDNVEESWGLNPFDPYDSLLDFDGDGVVNLVEYMAGTNPSDSQDYPENDQVLKDIIAEEDETIDLSGINPQGTYFIEPLLDEYPFPQNNILQVGTTGAYLYNIYDEDLIYRLRVSVTSQMLAMDEFDPGYSMYLEDQTFGIRIELEADAMTREVPIGIGSSVGDPSGEYSSIGDEQVLMEFDIVPYGLVLSKPAVVSIPGLAAQNPCVQRYDSALDAWVEVEDVSADADDGSITFTTRVLGHFKVTDNPDNDDTQARDTGGGGGGGCFISTAGI